MKKVYVVVRRPLDVVIKDFEHNPLVVIRGIFDTEKAAKEWRQYLWDKGERPETEVTTYFLRTS